MAIPMSIERNIALPGVEQANFVKYLTDANLPINNSKTIAYRSLYHILKSEDAAAGTSVSSLTFFQGNYVADNTNFPGNSFILPQSEHFLVTSIQSGRVGNQESTGLGTAYSNWRKGWSAVDSRGVNSVDQQGVNTAQYTFTVNGIVVQKDMPMSVFDNVLLTKERGRFELSQPILIPAQSDLSIRLSTTSPSGLRVFNDDQNDGYIWFELQGLALI